MRLVIINGPYTKGVFRKSCNVKLAKEIHQKLDEGLDCVDEETPTLVVGHLLKVSLKASLALKKHKWFAEKSSPQN